MITAGSTARRFVRLGVASGLGLLIFGAAATPALAHADIASTQPAAGETVSEPPTELVLTFTDEVEVPDEGPKVFDARGATIPTDGYGIDASKTQLSVPLPALDDGTYVVTWRALSADGHPIRGSFTFNVGAATATAGGLEDRLRDEQRADIAVGVAYGMLRALVFGAVLVVIGGFGVVLIAGRADHWRPRVRRTVLIALGLLAVAGAIELFVVGPYLSGGTLGDALAARGLTSTLDNRLGHSMLARLLLAAIGVGAIKVASSPRARPAVVASVAAVWSIAAALTFTLSGHPRTGRWQDLAVVVDVVHVVAAGLWIGGLVPLIAGLSAPDGDAAAERAIARRFSTLATVAVTVVVGTGTVQAVRQFGEPTELWSSSYGRLLIAKVAAVALIVAVGARSRAIVRDRDSAVRGLRTTVLLESAISVVVIALTALLVNASPPRATAASGAAVERTVTATASIEHLRFRVAATPGTVGPSDLVITVTDAAGEAVELFELTATIQLADRSIEPLDVPLVAGDDSYTAAGFVIPLAGRYTLALHALTGPLDQLDTTAMLTIT